MPPVRTFPSELLLFLPRSRFVLRLPPQKTMRVREGLDGEGSGPALQGSSCPTRTSAGPIEASLDLRFHRRRRAHRQGSRRGLEG
eukprot:598888-Hanusia_phi.AAC.1